MTPKTKKDVKGGTVFQDSNGLRLIEVAEVPKNQMEMFLNAELFNTNNKFEFLITSVTTSSAKLIVEQLSNEKNIIHRFFPIDKYSIIIKFLESWSPDLILFVDSEIWPNFLFEIKKRNIPLILLNGRITKKTFLRWNFIYKTAYEVFQNFDLSF